MIHSSYDTISLEQYETYFNNQFNTEKTNMTEYDMMTELLQNYDELYHDHPDCYNPQGYEDYLNELSEEELTELYNDTFN
jgi:hypothetical protein